MSTSENPKCCFVVMGFGTKTDLATGRKLNLDKSYRALVKPVVEGRGLVCVRADEIRHSGTIDLPMYQQLLTADIVVADLSTANVNAFYELGIRHALRPRTTIVISEDQLCYPFDLNHILITKYTHLGENIDYDEVLRFQKILGQTIDSVLNDEKPDSPVYTFLDNLIPPALKAKAEAVAQQVGEALSTAQPAALATESSAENDTLALILKKGEEAINKKDYATAKNFFSTGLVISNCDTHEKNGSKNSYMIQRLALCTYKAKLPDLISALKEAIRLLMQLDLDNTNDPETVGLAGAIEKRLYENNQGDDHLENAIQYYQRGYYLLSNRYKGINLAFLLNCRSDSSLDVSPEEKIADMVWANRIRREVLALCENDWKEIAEREQRAAARTSSGEIDDALTIEQTEQAEQKFWILANRAEAYLGFGIMDEYNKARNEALTVKHEDWMWESFEKQVEKLTQLLDKRTDLISRNWPENHMQPT